MSCTALAEEQDIVEGVEASERTVWAQSGPVTSQQAPINNHRPTGER
ncbi:hypothetical protein [Ottowia thiooxydans]|uniref:Uncharacterized protein n=1 Tax=Ottowia thiooxydans TaxID=219182 RepID=A0ABV2Q917_9BURK